MKRLIETMDTTRFWLVVFVMSVLFVFAYAYASNRDAVARNSALIERQQDQLVHLCETIRVADVVFVQLGAVAAQALGSGALPEWARDYFLASNALLNTAHQDLSEAQACRQIE